MYPGIGYNYSSCIMLLIINLINLCLYLLCNNICCAVILRIMKSEVLFNS